MSDSDVIIHRPDTKKVELEPFFFYSAYRIFYRMHMEAEAFDFPTVPPLSPKSHILFNSYQSKFLSFINVC